MKKVIGVVSEGPLDQMMIKTAVDTITGEHNIYRFIQPEQDVRGSFGNGWKGVYRWCEENAGLLPALFTQIMPQIELLIIQMDGDVSRKEKEAHCLCSSTDCVIKGTLSPLNCEEVKKHQCPIHLPCSDHETSPEGYRKHLEVLLGMLLGDIAKENSIVIVIPCDCADTWITAAYEDIDDIESVENPWDQIISAKKEYHGIRVPGHKKSAFVYRQFMSKVAAEWKVIKCRCKSAELFDNAIRQALSMNMKDC